MTAGGDPSRVGDVVAKTAGGRSGAPQSDPEGLGAFASETGSPMPAATPPGAAPGLESAPAISLESSTVISIALALAVIAFGGLTFLRWDRQPTDVKSVFQNSPPAAVPPAAAPPAALPPATRPPSSLPPAVATPEPTSSAPAPRSVDGAASARAAEPPTVAQRPSRQPSVVVEMPRPRTELSEDAPAAAPPPPPEPATVAGDARQPARPAVADTVAASPPRAAEPPVDRLSADREAIGSLLRSYRTSYAALDATSVSTIWQGLDTRALQRAFSTLSRQDVTFDRCDVRVTGDDRAAAVCRGLLTYVPKIGDGGAQQRRLAWDFDFQRAAGRWLITAVSAR